MTAQRRDQDKPAPIALNLDTLEHESAGPFVIVFDGKPMEFKDARELGFQKLAAALRNSTVFLRLVLSKEDATRLLAADPPQFKMEKLVDRYREHFGIGDLGE